MADRKSEAEAFRMAYGAGLVRRSEVIAWADQVIDQEEHPDPAFFEITTASRVDGSEFLRLLDSLRGVPDPSEVGALVLRELRDKHLEGTVSTAEVVRALYALAQHDRCAFPDEERAIMFFLDDEFELATRGTYGDVPTVTAKVDAFLERHARSKLLAAFGTIELDPTWDYKEARRKR